VTIFNDGADDFRDAAKGLAFVGARIIPAARAAMGQAGSVFAREWAKNATITAGEHGRHYPKSIDSGLALTVGSVSVDVGPNRTKRQGGMGPGFEFGSKNQPPHLDGLKAMNSIEAEVEALLYAVVEGTFQAATPDDNGLQEYTTAAGKTRLASPAQIANWTRGSR
jgi:hypothetical protein